MSGGHQDWDSVRIGGSSRGSAGAGAAAGRPRPTAAVVAAAKLDAATEPTRPKVFTLESKHQIEAYRRDNGLTQRLLDGRCGFPAGTVNALEGRQRGPTPRELQMLNNLLRTRLLVE